MPEMRFFSFFPHHKGTNFVYMLCEQLSPIGKADSVEALRGPIQSLLQVKMYPAD